MKRKVFLNNELFYKILKAPLFITLIGGFITGVIGNRLMTLWLRENLVNQVKLEIYRGELQKQKEFVDELLKAIYARLYNLKVYFWNLKDGATKSTVLESWEKYKGEVRKWNQALKYYFINLDRYFPSSEYKIGEFDKRKSLQKFSKLSFREILENVIQRQFVKVHSKLVETKKQILHNKKISQEYLLLLEKEIDYLNTLIYEFTEALFNAGGYQKIIEEVKRELMK